MTEATFDPARRAILFPLGALVVMLATLAIFTPEATTLPGDPGSLDDLGEAPTFVLQDQTGASIDSAVYDGKVQVVDFIFTSCQAVCPTLTRRMAKVGQALHDVPNVHLVSFSVDPGTDTPEVLAEYAQRYDATAPHWRFFTGSQEAINEVIAGYMMVAERRVNQDGEFDIVHSEKFLVVDERGHIRGFYNSDDKGLQQLTEDVRTLTGIPRS